MNHSFFLRFNLHFNSSIIYITFYICIRKQIIMKRILGSIFILFFVFNCTKEKRSDYVINGTAEGVYNGMRVYLERANENGILVKTDTAMIINNKFKFEGKVDYPKEFLLSANGIKGKLNLFIENEEITIKINKENIKNSLIEGSYSQLKMNEFNDTYNKLKIELKNMSDSLRNLRSKEDNKIVSDFNKKIKDLNLKVAEYPYLFIENNKDDYVVIPILESLSKYRNLDRNRFLKIYNELDENVKIASKKDGVGKHIDAFIDRLVAEKATAIGAKAPEFSAPNPDGEIIALNDVVKKGKITIIDFWAAWCGPCRRENPNIVNIYNKYHDKGLEIIGVGLDGRRGQRNPKEAWVKAIENDKLTWYQVSNLTYFDDIAKSYNVNSIPSMFILNNKGEIIAKNLRGKALEFKIAELLN